MIRGGYEIDGAGRVGEVGRDALVQLGNLTTMELYKFNIHTARAPITQSGSIPPELGHSTQSDQLVNPTTSTNVLALTTPKVHIY